MIALQLVALPVIAGLLWYGLGALVATGIGARGGGDRPERTLWPVLGFAACVLLGNGLPRLSILLPWLAIVIVALALAGLWLQRRNLLGSRQAALWAAAAAAPVALGFFLIFATAGPTITGYLVDTNTGVHALGADYLLREGADFAAITPDSSATGIVVQFFAGSSYPSGAHAVYGLLGSLSGLSLLWVNSPLMGILLALTAITAPVAVRGLGAPRPIAALAGVLASCGALTMSFALTGQLKELAALPLLVGATALALHPQAFGGRRGQLASAALLAAALYSVFGVAGAAWGGPLVIFVVLRQVAQAPAGERARTAGVGAATVAIIGTVLIAPLLPSLIDQVNLARSLSQANATLAADPGNLGAPIGKEQALGPWISPEHRYAPHNPRWTGFGIGIVALLSLVGLYGLLRRRAWWPLLWLAGMVALWFLLTSRGTMWTDSKLVMLNAHLFAVLTAAGVADLTRRSEQERPDWMLAAGLVVATLAMIVWSDALMVRWTSTASQGRFAELTEINDRFAGRGPALLTEFDEYGVYALRDVAPSGPGQAIAPGLSRQRTDGSGIGYGQSSDVDRLPAPEVAAFPLVVTATSPTRSAPPSPWQERYRGQWWTVFERDDAQAGQLVRHVPVDGPAAAVSKPRCSDVRSAARTARRRGGQLVARISDAPTTELAVTPELATPNWAAQLQAGPGVGGDGALTIALPAARQRVASELWIAGILGRPLQVADQDGRKLGRLPRRIGGDGTVVGPVRVPPGTTSLRIATEPRELRAGANAPMLLQQVLLEDAARPRVETIEPSDAERRLCSGPGVDWIDVVQR